MLEAPEVQYVRNGGVSLAYQVVGDGPIDFVEVPGLFTHLEMRWELPGLVRFTEQIAGFARIINLDRRGFGLSDRLDTDAPPTLAEQVDDVRAIMDAVGSREAVILGTGDGGLAATSFAATHPDRTRALVLYLVNPCGRRRADYPYGMEDAAAETILSAVEDGWGRGVMATTLGAEDLRPLVARVERRACTPHAAATYLRASLDIDVRPILPSIAAPTLVVHYADHPFFPPEGARYVAAHVPGATYVELEGYSGRTTFDRPALADAVEHFLTGATSVRDADRILTAVLFTDIVGSTERAATLGDRRWRDLLDQHDHAVRGAVEASGGRVVKTTGDGVLASFDGAARAVRCAQALVGHARRLGVEIRAGVHVGECERRGDDLAGMAIHVGARVAALAAPNEILVTSTVREALVGTDLVFEPRERRELRGVPGQWALFAATA